MGARMPPSATNRCRSTPHGGDDYVVVTARPSPTRAPTVDVDATCDGADGLRIVELGLERPITLSFAICRIARQISRDPNCGSTDSVEPEPDDLSTSITLAPRALRVQETSGRRLLSRQCRRKHSVRVRQGRTLLLCKSDCAAASDIIDVFQFADASSPPRSRTPPPLRRPSLAFRSGVSPSGTRTR